MKNTATLLISGLFVFTSCKKESHVDTTVTESEQETEKTAPILVAAETQCFLKVTGKDSLMLQMDRTGDSITGIFHWKPLEKDSKKSTFKGIIKGNDATTLATVSGEGMTTKEDFNFKVDDKSVTVKFAEMEEGKDGIWHYKNAQNSSGEVLQLVDCKK